MSLRDRVAGRLSEALEAATGYTIVDHDELEGLQESYGQYRAVADEAEDLAFWVNQSSGSLASDSRPEIREVNARRARRAFVTDPLLGTEATHYANFALGRGVGVPRAEDEAVQKVVDRAWSDNENLTSLDALTAISNELRAGANVYPLFFVGNGRIRTSFLNADDVISVRPSDEDRHTPLWYVVRHRELKWSYERHGFEADLAVQADPSKSVRYFAHHANVERDQKAETPTTPPSKDQLGEGLVYHLRVNRLLEAHFGTPIWQRTMRFAAGLNRLIEARVSMQMAASSIIAKRRIRGGQSEVTRSAQSVMNQLGEIGAGRPDRPAARRPPAPGSTQDENDGAVLEAVNLNSGASNAQTDIALVRGAAIAPSCMGQHYFGAGDMTNLASAATTELPTSMAVGAWQEGIEKLLRTFTELAIQEAVRSGELGGNARDESDAGKPLSELRLSEAEDLAVAERRTKKKLGFTFEMPYPGRRNLPDLVTLYQALTTQFPLGENEDGYREALTILLSQGLQMENAEEVAKTIAAAQQKLLKAGNSSSSPGQPPVPGGSAAPAPGQVPPTDPTSPDASPDAKNQDRPDTARPVYGEKRQTATGKGDPGKQAYEAIFEEFFPEGSGENVEAIAAGIAALLVARTEPAALAAAARVNGNGGPAR